MPATYEPIATTTLSSTSATVTFSSISGAYTDLVIIAEGTISSGSNFTLRFNGDTGGNYSNTELSQFGSSVGSGRNNNSTSMLNGSFQSTRSNTITHIQNYASTTTYKTAITRSNYTFSGVSHSVGVWRNTAAITSIEIGNGGGASAYSIGTTFTIYGIKAA